MGSSVKDYLKQVRALDLKIDQLLKDKEELRERAYCVSAVRTDGDKVQSSTNRETFEHLIAKVADMEADIDKMVDEYIDTKRRIIKEIHAINHPKYVELLHLKYIDYLKLEEIADVMKKTDGKPYSYDHIRRLHGEALEEFSKCHSNATLL